MSHGAKTATPNRHTKKERSQSAFPFLLIAKMKKETKMSQWCYFSEIIILKKYKKLSDDYEINQTV